MPLRRVRLLVLLWFVGAGVSLAAVQLAQPVTQPVLSIAGLGKGLAPLDGPWQFHIGDDPGWAAPDLNDTTGQAGWEAIRATDPWGMQGHPSYTGYAWYRRRLHIEQAPGASPDTALMILRIDDAYELYWNGILVGKNGKLPPDPVFYYPQPPQTFGLGPIRDGVLAIRVWKGPLNSFDSSEMGGLYDAPVVGSPTAIASRQAELNYNWLRRNQFNYGLQALYALVTVLSLLTWLRNRTQPVPFWMAVYSFSAVMAKVLAESRLLISYDGVLAWMQPLLGLQDISVWFLLLYLLQLNERRGLTRWTRLVAIVQIVATSLDGVVTALDGSKPWVSGGDAILTTVSTTLEIFPLVLVGFALRRRLDATRWPVAIAAFLTGMIQTVRVASIQGSRFTNWSFGNSLDTTLFTINGNSFTVEILANALLLLTIIYAVFRFQQESNTRRLQLEQEFAQARELQHVLIPDALPAIPGFTLTSAYKPALEVGGDFFQVIAVDEEQTLIILGDVSGKGLKASMAVSLIVGTVRTLTMSVCGPAELLTALNQQLLGRLQGGFATAIAILIDAHGRCTMASAGHTPPFINGSEFDLPGSLPLGLAPEIVYDELTTHINATDQLSLYTDGLLEARSPSGELYSFERMQALFATRPTAEQATAAAVAFGQDDDITVLTLTRLAPMTQVDLSLALA